MEERTARIVRNLLTGVIAAAAAGVLTYALVAPDRDELARLVVERDAFVTEVSALTGKVGALEREIEVPRKASEKLSAEIEQLRATLADKDKALAAVTRERGTLAGKLAAEAQELRAALAEKDKMLAAVRREREALAGKAAAAAEGLDEARARAAGLTRDYEALLKERKRLASADASHRAELERVRASLEAAQSEVARLTGARGIYTVQNGDHLSKIAAFFYRDGQRWNDIFRANAFLVSDPDLIFPSMVLIVPQ